MCNGPWRKLFQLQSQARNMDIQWQPGRSLIDPKYFVHTVIGVYLSQSVIKGWPPEMIIWVSNDHNQGGNPCQSATGNLQAMGKLYCLTIKTIC